MGKNKRKNFTPSALHELDEELRIVQTLNYRDVVWKTGDLVSVIEDDQEYHAQVAQPCHNKHVLNTSSSAVSYSNDSNYPALSSGG